MPTRVSTFTDSTLATLMSAANWNAWVDSWNAWLTFFGFSGAALLPHQAAGNTAIPRAAITTLQQNVAAQCPPMYQDVAPVDATLFWPAHTLATARAAAGLSGSSWTRQWFRQVANVTTATAYIDGDAFVAGELAYNRTDSRVYLRGASSWTLQPRNTFPTVKSGFGQAQQYDIITSTLINELAAVHQQLYYMGGGVTAPFPGSPWADAGCQFGGSPSDFVPFTYGDPDAATAETDADGAWSTATPSTSGENGNNGDSGPATFTTIAHKWTNRDGPDGTDWWQATRSTEPRKYTGTYGAAPPVGSTIELWAKIVRIGTSAVSGVTSASAEYEGPYAEDSIQQLGSTTRASGATTLTLGPYDFGSVGYPSATGLARSEGRARGCSTFRSQLRVDVRPALPSP